MTRLRENFQFDHIKNAKIGDSMHFHSYALNDVGGNLQLNLATRSSTDADGIAKALGMSTSVNISLVSFLAILEAKISPSTLVTIG